MSRYIDAEWLRSLYADFKDYGGRTDWETPVANVLATIDDAPSIDLVRCKECKHHTSDDECIHPHWDSAELSIYMAAYADDFCSYGERRNDE